MYIQLLFLLVSHFISSPLPLHLKNQISVNYFSIYNILVTQWKQNNTYFLYCSCYSSFSQVISSSILAISKIDTDDVSIIQVSTRLDEYENAQGSMLGGTIIYIKGTGFHSQADKNTIHIGPYPCLLIADGATENFLSCQTTPATDS